MVTQPLTLVRLWSLVLHVFLPQAAGVGKGWGHYGCEVNNGPIPSPPCLQFGSIMQEPFEVAKEARLMIIAALVVMASSRLIALFLGSSQPFVTYCPASSSVSLTMNKNNKKLRKSMRQLLTAGPGLFLLVMVWVMVWYQVTLLFQCQLEHLTSLDLFNCPVTQQEDYREQTFDLLSSLTCLDGIDRSGQEVESGSEEGKVSLLILTLTVNY